MVRLHTVCFTALNVPARGTRQTRLLSLHVRSIFGIGLNRVALVAEVGALTTSAA